MNEINEAHLAAVSVAPRVTFDQLLATIASEHYFTAADGVDGAYLNKLRISDTTAIVKYIPLEDDAEIAGTPMLNLSLMTFCVLTLENGFTVVGMEACASPENYDEAIGRHYARENAVEKLWPLLGYELKTQLHILSQGDDLPRGKDAEAQPSDASPSGAGEATGG